MGYTVIVYHSHQSLPQWSLQSNIAITFTPPRACLLGANYPACMILECGKKIHTNVRATHKLLAGSAQAGTGRGPPVLTTEPPCCPLCFSWFLDTCVIPCFSVSCIILAFDYCLIMIYSTWRYSSSLLLSLHS